jgi:hypothetical protein
LDFLGLMHLTDFLPQISILTWGQPPAPTSCECQAMGCGMSLARLLSNSTMHAGPGSFI